MKKKENFYDEKNLLTLIKSQENYDNGLIELNLDTFQIKLSFFTYFLFYFILFITYLKKKQIFQAKILSKIIL